MRGSGSIAAAVLGLLACGGAAAPPPPLSNVPTGAAAEAAEDPACEDPISGVWTARVWRDESLKWDQVTLRLDRTGPTTLVGEILVDTWTGDAEPREPERCPDRSPAVARVVQRARGTFDGGRIDVVGRDPRRIAGPCGAAPTGSYAPDHFTGAVDARGRLATVNDDGSGDQGRPHLFTREGCERDQRLAR